MRIPLDYYRVLGIPLQIAEDQISQAYQDRLIQLPRREYSEAAITSRNQLLQDAYRVLGDANQRQAYVQRWWGLSEANDLASQSGDLETINVEENTEAEEQETIGPLLAESLTVSVADELGDQNPSLEIPPEQLVGALLILQELGEYELVLQFAESALYQAIDPLILLETRADLVLTAALSYLELSREQWQMENYEESANRGIKGLAWLQQEDLFPTVQTEIRNELFKLRPYRILELLTLEDIDSLERQKGLQLLRDMIHDRFGIEGKGNDRSGLGVDDFLQFIQQLRSYLTVEEQEHLFLSEVDRPSVVASYLAVYALMAKAIAVKQPASLGQCRTLLVQMKNRQDVALEAAICALLLGQTEEALSALTQSRDQKAIAFIQEQSQGSPDLLPGLCTYTEHWLQNEIFPCFRDLSEQTVSLDDYFANTDVQTYLETLYSETSTPVAAVPSAPDQENTMARNLAEHQDDIPSSHPARRRRGMNSRSQSLHQSSRSNSGGTATLTAPGMEKWEKNQRPQSFVENVTNFFEGQSDSDSHYALPASADKPLSKRRKRRRVTVNPVRLSLVLLTAIACLGGGIFLWKFWSSPLSALEAEQLDIQLAQSPIEIPDPKAAGFIEVPLGPLTTVSAQQLIELWVNSKAAAFGPKHDVNRLSSILTGALLQQWQNRANQEKRQNSYRQYQHKVEVIEVKTNPVNPNQATIVAKVKEATEYFSASNPAKPRKTESDSLTVRYEVIRQEEGWRIQGAKVLPN